MPKLYALLMKNNIELYDYYALLKNISKNEGHEIIELLYQVKARITLSIKTKLRIKYKKIIRR